MSNIRLTSEQIKLITIHIVRDIETLRAATKIRSDMWGEGERFEQACWEVAISGLSRTGGITPRPIFEASVCAKLAHEYSDHGMTQDNITRALNSIFGYSESALRFALICPFLEEFLVARSTAVPMADFAMGRGDYVTTISSMYAQLQQVRVTAVAAEDLTSSTYDTMFVDSGRENTGCNVFDDMLKGIYPGQTIGLLGPMKGGKTSLLMSVVCDYLRTYSDRHVTYITYEESARRILPKLIVAHMNKHHRDELLSKKKVSEIDPQIYKEAMESRNFLAKRLSLVDMSGAREGQGLGGPEEMVSCIDNLERQGKLGPLVVIDHVLPMVRAHLNATNKDFASTLRHAISDTCNQLKAVCERLDITAILAHQMDAKGNSSPSHTPSHMDASECKLFAELLHDTLCLGTKTEEDMAKLNLSLTRSSSPHMKWVHIDGARCRVKNTSRAMTDDAHGGVISVDEVEHGRRVVDESGNLSFKQLRFVAKDNNGAGNVGY